MAVSSTPSHCMPFCLQKCLRHLGMWVCECSISIRIVDQRWFSPRRCLHAERYVFQVGQPQARCGVVGLAWRSKQSVIVMVFRQHCAVQGRSFEHFFMLAVLPLSSTVVLLFLRLEVILRLTLLHVFDFYYGYAVWAQQRSKLLDCCTLSRAFAFRDK